MKIQRNKLVMAIFLATSLSVSSAGVKEGWDAIYQNDWAQGYEEFASVADTDKDGAFLAGMLGMDSTADTFNPQKAETLLIKAAELGSGEAAFNLAYYYSHDVFSAEPEVIQKYLQQALDSDIYEAYIMLFMQYDALQDAGVVILSDTMPQYAQHMYDKFGSPLSAFILGALYLKPDEISPGFPVDFKQSEKYLLESYNNGFKLALMGLVELYQTEGFENNGKAEKYENILQRDFFEILSEGEPTVSPIGIMTMLSPQVKENYEKELLEKAQTDGTAAYQLGKMRFALGEDQAAKALWKQAIELGEYQAAIELYRTAKWDEKSEFLPYIEMSANLSKNGELFYYVSKIYDGYDVSRDPDKARQYLKKAADAGHLEAALIVANGYTYSYRDNYNLREATKRYRAITQTHPEDARAYHELARLLLSSDGINDAASQKEAHELLLIANTLEPDQVEVQYFLALSFDFKAQDFYDPAKSLVLYDAIINSTDTDEVVRDYQNSALYRKAMLLKDGAKNVPADSALAFKILTALPYDELGNNGRFALAQMYEKGIGTAINVDQAIKFYRDVDYMVATERLATLLMAKNDPELTEEALGYWVSIVKRDECRQDLKAQLLAHYKTSPTVQKWLSDVYTYSNYTDDVDALGHLKKASDAGNTEAQLYYGKTLIGKRDTREEGVKQLKPLADQNNIEAIKALLEYANDSQEEQYYLQIADIQKDDQSYQRLGDYYKDQERYQDAIAWYDKVQDQERSFLQSSRQRAVEALEAFEDLKQKATSTTEIDGEAQYKYARHFRSKGDHDGYLSWLKKSSDNEYSRATEEMARYLANSDNPEEQADATLYYLRMVKSGDTDGYDGLYSQYVKGRDASLDHDFMLKAMNKYAQKDRVGEYYYRNLKKVADAMENLTSSDPAIQLKAQKTIADAYENGSGISKNDEEYRALLAQLDQKNDGDAQYQLGELFEYGKLGFEQDWSSAIKMYKKAQANGTRRSVDDKIEFYETIVLPAQQGNSDAMYELARHYDSRESYYNLDLKPIIQKLKLDAANGGSEEAILYLADRADGEESIDWLKKGVALGSNQAKYQLAKAYYYQQRNQSCGQKNQGIDPKVVDLLMEASTAVPSAMDFLMNIYLTNGQINEALALVEIQPEDERTASYVSLGNVYDNGKNGVEKDYARALIFYEKAFENSENANIASYIADIYLKGGNHVAQSDDKAYEWYQKALDVSLRDAESEKNYYRYRDGVDYSEHAKMLVSIGQTVLEEMSINDTDAYALQAVEWLKEAVLLDNSKAADLLSAYYYENDDMFLANLYKRLGDSWDKYSYEDRLTDEQKLQTDAMLEEIKDTQKYIPYRQRLEELQKSGESGNGRAYSELGEIYQTGEIVPKDMDKAIEMYEKAGEADYLYAYNRLGNLFRKGGEGDVTVDMNKAVYYFDLGAKAGDSNCAHQAGDLYYFGEGGMPQDYAKALIYFDMADPSDGRHHANAKYKMAYAYYYGKGNVTKDEQKAYDLLQSVKQYDDSYVDKALTEWDFSAVKK